MGAEVAVRKRTGQHCIKAVQNPQLETKMRGSAQRGHNVNSGAVRECDATWPRVKLDPICCAIV